MPKEGRQQPQHPQELLKLKDDLLNTWQVLPPEHQVSILLVLHRQMRGEAEQRWTLDALQLLHPSERQAHREPPPIVISPITHNQIAELSLSDATAAALSDSDLHLLTTRLQAHFEHDLFWDELRYQVEQRVEEKREGEETLPDRKDV